MGSTRLPGKVLKKVNGVPLLKTMLRRVSLSEKINQIVIATSTSSNDDQIVEFCRNEGFEVFRGSEENVLSRYYDCATKYGATAVVRLTADCPLIDPVVIDDVLTLFENSGADFAANNVPPEKNTFPDGSDVEVFTYLALERAHKEADDPSDREHVTFYFWKDPSIRNFKIKKLINSEDWSKYRFTVDYPEDLEVVNKIITNLSDGGKMPGLSKIVAFLKEHPEVYELNSKYYFGQGWAK